MSTKMGITMVALAVGLAGCVSATPTPAPSPPAGTPAGSSPEPSGFAEARQSMVGEVRDWGVRDERVLEALGQVPRHEFVPTQYLDQAYANHPLPIGHGQTISQPYIVGLMSEELGVESGDKVLEVGTGSGYQAAVLAELGVQVYSVEIIGALAVTAEERLERLGYEAISVRHADGYFGWDAHAPYDGIIVTAAPDHVPQPLVAQLKVGARMIVPVGPPGGYQELWKVTKVAEGQVESESLGGVRFVPLVREESP